MCDHFSCWQVNLYSCTDMKKLLYFCYSSVCVCCYKAALMTHLKKNLPFFLSVSTIKRGREGERATFVFTTVSQVSPEQLCAHGRQKRQCMTEKNKRGRVGHHSSTTGISINILQWCRSQPTALEQWRHVSHCLVCLPVAFGECRAQGVPEGKTWILDLSQFSTSQSI